jgi:hypothetical protein
MVSGNRDRGNLRWQPYWREERPVRGWTRRMAGLLICAHARGGGKMVTRVMSVHGHGGGCMRTHYRRGEHQLDTVAA